MRSIISILACLLTALLSAACDERDPSAAAGGSFAAHPSTTARWFTDITNEVGLDFVHEAGADGQHHMPAVMGGGAALLDFDNDGDLDLYLTNGNRALPEAGSTDEAKNRLYRHEADGRYVDVTSESGLGDPGYGMGVAVGDIDNDGDVDVYMTNYGPDRLYRNEGGGADGTVSFVDVTSTAGVRVGGWSSSAAFLDFDRDGFLDLYVTRYVDYHPDTKCAGKNGAPDFCGPLSFPPVHDVLLHNQADGTFIDVSEAAGIASISAAGLGIACLDIDGDGWQDVYVANDGHPNQLWINQGDATFRDDSLILGVAYNLHGQAQAGMGVIAEDFDGTGTFDLFMTHLLNEANTFYSNLGGTEGFNDVSGTSGLGPSSMSFTGFGVAALDVELDGDLDLFIANGKVNIAEAVPGSSYPPPWDSLPEPNLFYLNDGGGRFTPAGEPVRVLGSRREISRGVASGDIDGDGDVDLLVSNLLDRARLYRNDAPRQGHWLAVRALDPLLRRDALGAQVTLVTGARRAVRHVATSFGYLASHSPWLHFGVGEARAIDRIKVRWPDGSEEVFPGGATDRSITLRRGSGEPADG